jgi:hypothetical protein
MTMNCKQCGHELKPRAKFCGRCGARVSTDLDANDLLATRPTKVPDHKTAREIASRQTEIIAPVDTSSYGSRPERVEKERLSQQEPETEVLLPDEQNLGKRVKAYSTPAGPAVATPAALKSTSKRRVWIAVTVPAALLVTACSLFFIFKSSAERNGGNQVHTLSSPTPIAEKQSGPATTPTLPPPDDVAKITEMETMTGPSVKRADTPTQRAYKESQPSPTLVVRQTPVPSSAEYYLKQGAASLNARKYQEAVNELEKARQMSTGNPDLYYLLGSAYHGLGKRDEALAAYRRCTSGVYAEIARNNVRRLEKEKK